VYWVGYWVVILFGMLGDWDYFIRLACLSSGCMFLKSV